MFARLRSVHKFLKAKQSEGKPVDAYREQLESVWRRHVESVSIHKICVGRVFLDQDQVELVD